MKDIIRIYPDPKMSAAACAAFIDREITRLLETKTFVSVALSGGSTPALLFRVLVDSYSEAPWIGKVKFFWVDERCVAPDDPESNYGAAKKLLLDPLGIKDEMVFRIHGENNPADEVARYTSVLQKELETDGVIDICLLGMGSDGHTASVFPQQISLMTTSIPVAETKNPYSGQRRITMTGKLINNSLTTIFLAHGKEKKDVLKLILDNRERESFPAGFVINAHDGVYWFLDTEAYRLP